MGLSVSHPGGVEDTMKQINRFSVNAGEDSAFAHSTLRFQAYSIVRGLDAINALLSWGVFSLRRYL